MITPNDDKSWDTLTAFTERLKSETDPNTLNIGPNVPSAKFIGYWVQYLTQEEVVKYKQDPAVS